MPAFGTYLRAARLGYRFSKRHKAFIRIDSKGPPWQVILAAEDVSPGRLQALRPASDHHVCWWDADDPEGGLSETSAFFRRMENEGPRRGKTVVAFINFEGEEVR